MVNPADLQAHEITKVYEAAPTAAAFHLDNSFIRGLMGPLGGGKSTTCIMEIMKRGGEQTPGPGGIRRTRWAVTRSTYRELLDSTVRSFHQWIPPTPSYPRRWRVNDMNYHIVENGLDIEILFRALDRPDDVKKLLSTEYTGAWVNEAREADLSIITGTKGGLAGRVGRFPPENEEGCTWTGIFMDTNPPDEDHWWFKKFEEEKPEGWHVFKQPSARSARAENLKNLRADYYKNMMSGAKLEWVKVYIDGQYGFVIEGKPVYGEDYIDSIHCAAESFGAIPNVPVFVGLDFGLTPAAVFGQIHPRGHWQFFDELIGDGIGIVRFAEILRQKIQQKYEGLEFFFYGDPSGEARSQTDEKSCFDILASEGIEAKPAPTNNPILRIEAVRQALKRTGFIISPACRVFRKGFMGGYHYKRVQIAGEERYHDEPDKNHFSHIHDAAQMAILGAGGGKKLFPPARQRDERPEWEKALHRKKAYAGSWMGR